MPIDPKFAREKLREEVCEVIFTKKNGEERTMFATLMPEFLPLVGGNDHDDTDYDNSLDTITVLDLEINEWRAFNASRVKEFRHDVQISGRPLADLYR